MEEFAETVASSRIRHRLFEALSSSKKVFRRFKDVLEDYPDERDRYYKFLRKYCEGQIIEWLKEKEIEITLKSFDTGQPKKYNKYRRMKHERLAQRFLRCNKRTVQR
jgi:hypothetical protein